MFRQCFKIINECEQWKSVQLDTGYLALLPALGKGACPCWGQKETDLQTWQGVVGWLPGPYPAQSHAMPCHGCHPSHADPKAHPNPAHPAE